MANTSILTAKEESFIACINRGLSGTEAAKISYNTSSDNSAASIASQNLRKLKIVSRIDRSINEYTLIDKAIKDLALGLKAKKYLARPNVFVPDHATRFRSAQALMRLHGIKI